MKRVAAIDIGTNTTRLLVADVADAKIRWCEHRSTVTRLGQGVDATGELHPEAMTRTVAVLSEYAGVVANWECDAVRVVATSATRDASNRVVFLDHAEAALGVRPEVIDGHAEAALTFAGAAGSVIAPPPFLVIDPGGGSTEFVFGSQTPELAVSVDIGSVRLTERALPNKPASVAELASARRHVDELLESAVAASFEGASVVGVGGTYAALAAVHLALDAFDVDAVHGCEMAAVDLHELGDRLAALTLAELEEIPSLDPARAPVLLGGTVVAERALCHVGATAITISARGILDGIALSVALA